MGFIENVNIVERYKILDAMSVKQKEPGHVLNVTTVILECRNAEKIVVCIVQKKTIITIKKNEF